MIAYRLFSAGGNTTALVYAPIALHDRPKLSKQLIAAVPGLEQVGFITTAKDPSAAFRLEMMGDELCVNAARCAAYAWMHEHAATQCEFEISGYAQLVSATVHGTNVHITFAACVCVSMRTVPEGTLLDLQGIRYVVTTDAPPIDRIAAIIQKYAGTVPAVGHVQVCEGEHTRIVPHIYVAGTQTLIAETACGSGTIAASLAAWRSSGTTQYEIMQPSGSRFRVELRQEGSQLTHITLSGEVSDLGYISYPTRSPVHFATSH